MIPNKIIEQIDSVSCYTDDCDDWVEIKKQIMLGLPSHLRKLFSTRDPITKEQRLSDFDREVINYYREKTGISLILRTLEQRREIFGVL
tara:strand:+ start:12 stop:278 length:267 start_codon:yes stop_codon:yes gene_type:complete